MKNVTKNVMKKLNNTLNVVLDKIPFYKMFDILLVVLNILLLLSAAYLVFLDIYSTIY